MRFHKLILILGLLLLMESGCDRFSVQKQLEKYVADQLKEHPLPRRINSQLTLIDIQVGEKELIQTFKIKGSKAKIQGSVDELEQQVKEELRQKKAKIQNFIKYKIVMKFKYLQQQSEELLHEFQVNPWEDL